MPWGGFKEKVDNPRRSDPHRATLEVIDLEKEGVGGPFLERTALNEILVLSVEF